MDNYNLFAKFYDASMGDRQKTVTLLQQLIKKYNPKAQSILELACGTGEVLKPLSSSYKVSGLDLSSGMLAIAKKKIPNAKFYLENMANFNLDERFDVILCVFDSINHLLKFSDWLKVFTQSKKHLNPGGVFIFDINTINRLEELSAQFAGAKEFNGNYLVMKVTNIGKNLTNWNLKVFEKKQPNNYFLTEEDVKEVSFPIKQVKTALMKKFKTIKLFDKNQKKPTKETSRVYFVCKN